MLATCGAGNQPGTVYAIIVNEEYVKIGFTKFQDARGRIADIQKGCPYPFRLALEHKGGFPFEQAIHHLFQSYRLRDEWFRYEGQLKEFIDGVEVITRS